MDRRTSIGFSLLEILISLGLCAMMLPLLFQAFTYSSQRLRTLMQRMDRHMESHFIKTVIRRDAESALISSIEPHRIHFETPNSDQITYFIKDKKIVRILNGNTQYLSPLPFSDMTISMTHSLLTFQLIQSNGQVLNLVIAIGFQI